MPQYPHCQSPFEEGQRYCSVCGTFLHPEEGDQFCPQCGTRVIPQQVSCHECNAPLKGEAPAAAARAPEAPAGACPPEAPAAGAPPKGMQPWVLGLVIGVGVIIAILLILLFTRVTPTPPLPPKAEAPAEEPTARGTTAPTPAPALKEQLQGVLANLREAHLKKDILLYMNCYSLAFPDRDAKRKETLKTWDNYDYANLVFTLSELQPLDSENAIAQATWYIDTRDRRTQELGSLKQVYQIRFAKELGNWRIRSLEEID